MKYFVFLFIFIITNFNFWSKTTTLQSQIQKDENKTPEEELAGFKLPEGFIIELVASEQDGIINPVQLTFDDKGRLWTQTARMYPLDPVADIPWDTLIKLMDDPIAQRNHPNFKRILDLYQGKTKGADQVLVISDLYDPNKKPKTSVWAEGLAIPMSILPYKDGAYVAQGSELFFLNDSDNNGAADKRAPVLTGFGFTDTHTMAHMLRRGPGGWIYFSHGALNKGEISSFTSDVKQRIDYSKIARFSMDGKKLELVNSGLNNIWGFHIRGNGQWYGSEANDLGYSVAPMEPGTGFPGIGSEKLRPYQPLLPELHTFRVGGTGLSSLTFSDDASGSFPEEWKDVALLANPITSTINAVKIIRNADGTVTSKHLADLLTSKDKFFRPVNLEFGPDGCLYIADWYNKIISHNEISTTHPDRDKSHGRIWRIRHISQTPHKITDFTTVKTKDLVKHLTSPTLWAKRAAWHQITDRPAQETKKLAPSLVKLANDPSIDETSRIIALWSLEGLHHYDYELMSTLLKGNEHNLQREAIRSLASFPLNAEEVGTSLKNLIEDPNPMIRSQVLRTLSDIGKADASTIDILVRASKPELPGDELGGPYERKFERYLALKALEQYPKELSAYINSSKSSQQPPINLLWAIQALPKAQMEETFLKLWALARLNQLDEPTFIWVSKMLENPKIYSLMKPLIGNPEYAVKYINLSLKTQQQTQSAELSSILELPAKTLLKSNIEADRQLALDAIGHLKIKTLSSDIVSVINEQASPRTIDLTIKALENNAMENKDTFLRILKNERFDFDLRAAALHSLSKADPTTALKTLEHWIPKLDYEQKRILASVLSISNQGSNLLMQIYSSNLINHKSFDLSAAERIYNSDPNNKPGTKLLKEVKQQIEEEKEAFNSKLSKYMAIAQKKGGNEQKGKTLFQTCLMCHKVGQEGLSIAPALDGSSARDNEALLTSILEPDAAVEGGYAIYRVTKKDNNSMEGYLFKKDDRGVTISFMGGSQIFTPIEDIKSQGFIGGRSFMPRGLIERYSDEQVADLLAYIRTLK